MGHFFWSVYMKALLIIDQNEKVKNIVANMNETIEAHTEVLMNLKKEHQSKMKVFWNVIEMELESLGLIEKDENGEYPNLRINREEQVLYHLEKDEDDSENVLGKLKKALSSILD
jgi:hypothetical protein